MPEKSDAAVDKGGKRRRRRVKETDAGKLPPKYTQTDEPTTADPHIDKNLDHGLDETFPASDPVSILPGAD